MGRKPRRKLSTTRRVLLIAGSVCVLLAGLYAWWLFGYRPPVEYPEDWPLEYVTVPDGAWAERIPLGRGKNQGEWSFSTDWLVHSDNVKIRFWVIGFQYEGDREQANAYLSGILREKEFLAISSTTFYSPDYRYQVVYRLHSNETYQGKSLWQKICSRPNSWTLKISEFNPSCRDPILEQWAVPIE